MRSEIMRAVALAALVVLVPVGTSEAGEFVGIDPYGRHIYAPVGSVPIVPNSIRGPSYQRNPGPWAGPAVAGPLYYAEPAPPVPGFYRPDSAVEAGAILAFDTDAALAAASQADMRDARCAARYRSYDPATGTFLARGGVRRSCR